MQPAPAVETQNPPTVVASQGDRFAIEWAADAQTVAGRFNYYKSASGTGTWQIVFTTANIPAKPFSTSQSYTLYAKFAPAANSRSFIHAMEVQFQ